MTGDETHDGSEPSGTAPSRTILCRTWTHLRRDPRQVLEVAADAVGLLDDGVHAQLGDLVDERVLVAFSVLHHCGQQGESR